MDPSSPEKLNVAAPRERRLEIEALKALVQRRKKPLKILVPALFVIFLCYGLLLSPQSFSAYVSLSMQQNTPTLAQGLGLLGGASSGGARYLGVLRSRHFAEQVENVVRTQRFYELKGANGYADAVEALQKAVKVEDSTTDSLLLISTEVAGPPRLNLKAGRKKEEAKQLSAKIVNTYAEKFRQYLRDTDTDHDAVLYREGEGRLKKADDDYRAAVSRFVQFAKGKEGSKATPLTAAATDSDGSAFGGAQVTAAMELQTLYIRRGALERLIKSGEVAQAEVDAQLRATGQLYKRDLGDPLLQQARQDVSDAQIEVDRLRISLADSNPKLVAALKALKAAEKRLLEQAHSIQQRNTSEAIKLEAERAELITIERQIDEASRRFKVGKDATTDLEAVKGDLAIALEVLKATSTEFAKLSLETVSGQSRMVVIDKGIEPRFGKPGIIVTLILSALGALIAASLLLAIDYVLHMVRASDSSPEASENLA